MKMRVYLDCGRSVVADGVCDHDFNRLVKAVAVWHRRWLPKLRQNFVVVEQDGGNKVAFAVKSIKCVELEQ